MKKAALLFLIAVLLCMRGSLFAEKTFKPWNAAVRVGDETTADMCVKKYRARPGPPVFNGFEAGALLMIRFFQKVISPQDGPNCRFRPVCSVYGARAVEKYGAFAGAVLAGERILRCNPFTPPGYDPVPERIFSDR